jgi:hypothetical protein
MDGPTRIVLGVGLVAGSIWAMTALVGPSSPYYAFAWAALWVVLLTGLAVIFWPYIHRRTHWLAFPRTAWRWLKDQRLRVPWESKSALPAIGLTQIATATVRDTVGRRIDNSLKESIVEDLRERGISSGGPIEMRYLASCAECKAYAMQLADILASAGWLGEAKTTTDERREPEVSGLLLCVANMDAKPRNANILAGVFRAAKVDFGWWQWPELGDQTLVFVYPQKTQPQP